MSYKENLFLAGLSGEDFGRLESHISLTDLPLGREFCAPEEEIEHIWFPFSGVVSLLNVLEDGSEVECCTMGNDTAFGLTAAQEPARSFTRDVIQIGGDGAFMTARAMRGACAASASLRTVVQRHLHAAMGFMAQSVACNARHKLDARLCRWLLTCAEYVDGDYLPLTQEFIAAMLGVQRTSVTDAVAGLQEGAVIKVVRGKVTILDLEALRERSCECHEVTRTRLRTLIGRPIRRAPVNGMAREVA